MRLVAAIAACLAQGSCFSPTESDGTVRCGAGGDCPPGFTCGGDGFCHRGDGPAADAAAIDAPVIDASDPDIDAPTVVIDAALLDDGAVAACSNGMDDDCDGLADYPNDTGCSSSLDDDEHHIPNAPGSKACDDGIDNDGDGDGIDYHAVSGCGDPDPQCSSPTDPSE